MVLSAYQNPVTKRGLLRMQMSLISISLMKTCRNWCVEILILVPLIALKHAFDTSAHTTE